MGILAHEARVTGILPVRTGWRARRSMGRQGRSREARSNMGRLPVTHRKWARCPCHIEHGQDAHATQKHGQDAHATTSYLRSPKIAVPMRTMVAPSSTATR
jgi:hypothetical protein